MTRPKSLWVCSRCGLAVYHWSTKAKADGGGPVWKHAGGWHASSCGKPPKVVERAVYEAEMAEFIDGAIEAVKHPNRVR